MEKKILNVNMVEGRCRLESLSSEEGMLSGLPLALEIYKQHNKKAFVMTFTDAGVISLFTSPQSKKVYYSFSSKSYFDSILSSGIVALVIEGVARKLSFLMLSNTHAEVRQCEQLRFSSPSVFSSLFLDEGVMLSIGCSGEKLSCFSSLFTPEGEEIARGGVGAVLSSMNLKGILIEGAKEDLEIPAYPSLNKSIKCGFLPFEYFSGASDPRLMHLSSLSFFPLVAATSNMGFFSPERAKRFKDATFEEGLSLSESAEVIAYMRFKGELKEASFDDILSYIHQMGEGRKVPSIEKMLLTAGHMAILDYRGAPVWAVFSSFSESFIPYISLEENISRHFTPQCAGIVAFYLRLYTHASFSLGFRDDLLPNIKHLISNPSLLRLAFRKMLKEKAFVLAGLSSMEAYDSEVGGRASISDYFSENVGADNYVANLRYAPLMEAYEVEKSLLYKKLNRNRSK